MYDGKQVLPTNEAKFMTELRQALTKRVPQNRHALVYIHGYNVSFNEAVLRAAQIGFDLKVEGITALYSWPSMGSLFGYAADVTSVESSENFLKEFLTRVALEAEAEEVDISHTAWKIEHFSAPFNR